MPLHEYIKRIYQEVEDSLYIIRFLNYLINTRYKRVSFTVNGIMVQPLITGTLIKLKIKNYLKVKKKFLIKRNGKKMERFY